MKSPGRCFFTEKFLKTFRQAAVFTGKAPPLYPVSADMIKPGMVEEAERLVREWLRRHAASGQRLPSGVKIARELGIGYYELNRALGLLVAEGTIERTGNTLTMLGGRETKKRGGVCHLVIARRSTLLAGYRKMAKDRGLKLEVKTWQAVEEAVVIMDGLDASRSDGVVCDLPVHGRPPWVEAARRLNRRGVPVVCMGGPIEGMCSVSINVAHGVMLAIQHLTSLGHRDIALMTQTPLGIGGFEMIDIWRGECARIGCVGSAERILFHGTDGRVKPCELSRRLTKEWRAVTAVVLRDPIRNTTEELLAELAGAARTVPESLSLVVVGNDQSLPKIRPRVTEVAVDFALCHEMIFSLLRRGATRVQPMLGAAEASVQVLPRLTVRDSSRAVDSGRTGRSRFETSPPKGATATGAGKGVSPAYALAMKASLAEKSRFRVLDLSRVVNRPLGFRRGWLGDLPLCGLVKGTREFHGVPFRLLGGKGSRESGAVVMRSAINVTGLARRLPEKVSLAVGMKTEAVYILHGCGYAKRLGRFAEYRFVTTGGREWTVPLVSLGMPEDGGSERTVADDGMANIQDWWSDFPHGDFPGARMVPLVERDERAGSERHVFLYTLEWINPDPSDPLRRMEIRSDVASPTTLGVLAVTVVQSR